MPEGDSVYLVARRLERSLDGHTLTRSDLRVPQHATADLVGHRVLAHDTHGKHLLTRLSGDLTLHTHLRMDGSWTVTGPGKQLPRRLMPDVRVVLGVDSGSTAYGVLLPVVDLVRTSEEATVIGHLGPDPLRADWDEAEAVRRLEADPGVPLAAAILDQRLVAGWGNLWANELCFLRGHSPWTPIGDVDVPALVRLGVKALRRSAKVPGAYQVTTGNTRRGEQHYVAGRARRPCLRCGTEVRVVDAVVNDPSRRRTWWCPTCQPGPGPDAVQARAS
ncbi:Fpg/Nei family DNA glycosylase [Nocardioides sp. HDW12B]|uniref:DNA-formamidopyrimidine glycosylase family protein n=1 Tax=Nocardioides sp. HDW12B TaxID=2714939 RepID=UPI00140BBBCD|nr:DNA-formamidopyrimidine glycosylase family protein [Nocardioides sp. HDW12B]QIK67204.1 Fpg/Nei family DNA glycosylase [Nocardioides sp. HDW12B]